MCNIITITFSTFTISRRYCKYMLTMWQPTYECALRIVILSIYPLASIMLKSPRVSIGI